MVGKGRQIVVLKNSVVRDETGVKSSDKIQSNINSTEILKVIDCLFYKTVSI